MKKLLFLSLFFSFPLFAFASFTDVNSNHPNADAITYVQVRGIVNGYSDNTYKPDNPINRAEFTKIIINATAYSDISGGNCFHDVQNEWFAPYVCTAKTKNIIAGYADGNFKPNQNISFVEAAKIISNSFGLPLEDSEIWYEPFVKNLGDKKAIPVSIQNLEHEITRGEMAEMIYRILEGMSTKSSMSLSEGSLVENSDDETDF